MNSTDSILDLDFNLNYPGRILLGNRTERMAAENINIEADDILARLRGIELDITLVKVDPPMTIGYTEFLDSVQPPDAVWSDAEIVSEYPELLEEYDPNDYDTLEEAAIDLGYEIHEAHDPKNYYFVSYWLYEKMREHGFPVGILFETYYVWLDIFGGHFKLNPQLQTIIYGIYDDWSQYELS